MASVLQNPALLGLIGRSTASFFALDPTGTTPVEILPDLVPGVTPLRITFDLVDQETFTEEWDVTENSLQDFTDVASNIRRRLRSLSITGTLSSSPPSPAFGVPPPPVPAGVRLDFVRAQALSQLAAQRRPIAVVTPRVSLPQAFFTSISRPWSPDNGQSTIITVTLREARKVSPITADAIAPDFGAQVPGNNQATGGGQQAGTEVTTQAVQPSGTTGVPPVVTPR